MVWNMHRRQRNWHEKVNGGVKGLFGNLWQRTTALVPPVQEDKCTK